MKRISVAVAAPVGTAFVVLVLSQLGGATEDLAVDPSPDRWVGRYDAYQRFLGRDLSRDPSRKSVTIRRDGDEYIYFVNGKLRRERLKEQRGELVPVEPDGGLRFLEQVTVHGTEMILLMYCYEAVFLVPEGQPVGGRPDRPADDEVTEESVAVGR